MSDCVVSATARAGCPGVFLLMPAGPHFPPVRSELVMPLAGFLAARGIARMPPGASLLLTAPGSAGDLLEGRYGRMKAWVGRASTLVAAFLPVWYLARLVRLRRA